MPEPTGTQYGGFWARFLALLADLAIVFLIVAALVVGVDFVLGPEALVTATIAVSLLGLLYWPVMHASALQATLGKAIVGLKVTRFDGRRISILRSAWRELAKIFSAAVFMLGYLVAAFMPRKQGLHDLMAATYVVREGPSRVIAALAVAAAGVALPVVVGPMVASPAVMTTLSGIAKEMARQDLVKQVPGPVQDLMRQIAGSARELTGQVSRPTAPAQKVAAPATPPKPEAPKPEAPKPEAAKPEAAKAEPNAPTVVEPAQPAAAKPKAPAAKTVARAAKPAAPGTSEVKRASGPRYNDLMTAVLHRDVEAVNQLLKLGKWVDKPDSRGTTPLMVAAGLDDVRTAEALLRGGANARLALPVAEERRNGEMVQLLKRYARTKR